MPTWVAPTWRALPLAPLASVTASLILLSTLIDLAGERPPAALMMAACGAIVAGGALALDDPAHQLLQALPTTLRTRIIHRVTLIAPLVAVAAAATVVVALLTFGSPLPQMPTAAALGALFTSATAVKTWWARRRPDDAATAAAASVMLLTAAPLLVPAGFANQITSTWLAHPWPTLAASLTLVTIGSRPTTVVARRSTTTIARSRHNPVSPRTGTSNNDPRPGNVGLQQGRPTTPATSGDGDRRRRRQHRSRRNSQEGMSRAKPTTPPEHSAARANRQPRRLRTESERGADMNGACQLDARAHRAAGIGVVAVTASVLSLAALLVTTSTTAASGDPGCPPPSAQLAAAQPDVRPEFNCTALDDTHLTNVTPTTAREPADVDVIQTPTGTTTELDMRLP